MITLHVEMLSYSETSLDFLAHGKCRSIRTLFRLFPAFWLSFREHSKAIILHSFFFYFQIKTGSFFHGLIYFLFIFTHTMCSTLMVSYKHFSSTRQLSLRWNWSSNCGNNEVIETTFILVLFTLTLKLCGNTCSLNFQEINSEIQKPQNVTEKIEIRNILPNPSKSFISRHFLPSHLRNLCSCLPL